MLSTRVSNTIVNTLQISELLLLIPATNSGRPLVKVSRVTNSKLIHFSYISQRLSIIHLQMFYCVHYKIMYYSSLQMFRLIEQYSFNEVERAYFVTIINTSTFRFIAMARILSYRSAIVIL